MFRYFTIGGPFGAMMAGTVSNKKGRWAAITVNTWLYIFGGELFRLAQCIMWLIPARFLVGFVSLNVYRGVLVFISCIRLVPFSPLFLVVTTCRFVLRPASFYTKLLRYIYVFFNRTFSPLDGNLCHSLNCLSQPPDPSLSLAFHIIYNILYMLHCFFSHLY